MQSIKKQKIMNKLRDKFNEMNIVESDLIQCEQITDEFSVKFAEWYLDNYHMNKTTTELLQMFKEKIL